MEHKIKVILSIINDIAFDQRLIRISYSLSKCVEVHIICRSQTNKKFENQQIKVHYLNCYLKKGIFGYAEFTLKLFIKLLFLPKFDIYTANDADTLLPNAWMSKIKNGLLFYDSHEYWAETPEIKDRPIVKFVWTKIEKWGITRAHKCYTVANELSKILSSKFGKPFKVVRNVPLRQSALPLVYKENILIYQGVLNKGRGLECCIEALKELKDYTLWLVGDGDIKSILEQMVLEYQLTDRVKFLGKLLPEELRALTHKAKYGINLLESDSLNYYYSLSNKFFDYLQAGIPSINMAFPEYLNLLQHHQTGLTIDDLTPQKFANCILSIDEDKYKWLVENCIKASSEWCWEKEEIKLLQIYIENS